MQRWTPIRDPKVRDRLAKRYAAGSTLAVLADEVGVTPAALHYRFKAMGVKMRHSHRRINVDTKAFDHIKEEAAYWIGFLLADGNISKDKKRIQMCLQSGDIRHVEKFKKFLSSPNKINHSRTRAAVHFSATSPELVQALEKFGVVPQKSMSATGHVLTYSPAFWRGVVDGDGSLLWSHNKRRTPSPCIALCGSLSLMQQYLKFINLFISTKAGVIKNGSIWQVRLSCSKADAMIRMLYSNASIALDRKATRAQQLLSRENFGGQDAF